MTNPHDPLPPMAVVISPKEIYDAIVRLTGRVDVLIVQHDDMKNKVQDLESRMRMVEASRWPLPALAVLLSIAAIVLKFIP